MTAAAKKWCDGQVAAVFHLGRVRTFLSCGLFDGTLHIFIIYTMLYIYNLFILYICIYSVIYMFIYLLSGMVKQCST